jgi:hypothetical protein
MRAIADAILLVLVAALIFVAWPWLKDKDEE